MSLQTDQRTGLDELEALDFDYDPPCEGTGHGNADDPGHGFGSAWAIVRLDLPCGHSFTKYYCKRFVDWLSAGEAARCPSCRTRSKDYSFHIIALVRP